MSGSLITDEMVERGALAVSMPRSTVRIILEAIEPMLEKLIDDAKAEGAWGGPDWRDHL